MPVYEFYCPACQSTADRESTVDARDEPMHCKSCSTKHRKMPMRRTMPSSIAFQANIVPDDYDSPLERSEALKHKAKIEKMMKTGDIEKAKPGRLQPKWARPDTPKTLH